MSKSYRCYGILIESVDDVIFINGNKTNHTSFSEAIASVRSSLEEKKEPTKTKVSYLSELYVLKRMRGERINNLELSALNESIVNKTFTTDKYCTELRANNPDYRNKLMYIMEDGSKVLLDIETLNHINSLTNLDSSSADAFLQSYTKSLEK